MRSLPIALFLGGQKRPDAEPAFVFLKQLADFLGAAGIDADIEFYQSTESFM